MLKWIIRDSGQPTQDLVPNLVLGNLQPELSKLADEPRLVRR
jgi:hypothetical protein